MSGLLKSFGVGVLSSIDREDHRTKEEGGRKRNKKKAGRGGGGVGEGGEGSGGEDKQEGE